MSQLYFQIYTLVKQIPSGCVATYGQIAALTGNPRRSRVVGYAMAGCKDHEVPCHRVIRSTGDLSVTFGIFGNVVQRDLLLSEGVAVMPNGKVDLAKYQWQPHL